MMKNNKIHPSAIIEDSVILGNNITIGPYCYLSGDVIIGDNCILHSHIVIGGNVKIGKNNSFFSFTNIGAQPQDLKYEGEKSAVEIGDNNIFRENITVHSGTLLGNGEYKNLTKVGSNSLFMVGVHIAHDCIISDNVVLANNATLGGHVVVGNNVVIGGLSAVKQFIRIGDYAMIGGMSGVENDVIPYGLVSGERANLAGLNLVGLKRHKFSKDDIANIKQVYGELFNNNTDVNFLQRVDNINQDYQNDKLIALIIKFILEAKKNPICKPKNYNV